MIKAFLKMPIQMMRRLYRLLWLRVTFYAIASLAVAGVGSIAEVFFDERFTDLITPEAVMPVLTILATSMLAVSTFSLNVMVSSHRSAAQNATPRVHRLLLEDTTTQSVLATFVGAFVFALTSIVLFQSGVYRDSAAIVTMIVTVIVVVMVIVAILRWIKHLSTLGSLDDSLRMVLDATQTRLVRLAKTPALGGVVLTEDTVLPDQLSDVFAPVSGFVQLIDVHGLQESLNGSGAVYVLRGPGKHVLKGQVIARVSGHISAEALRALAHNFVFGTQRSFEQDPVFGLHVLSEIASKALSPGVNDPGTAIETIVGLKEVLWAFAKTDADKNAGVCAQVFVPVPNARELFQAAFHAMARDGAGQIEVGLKLRKSLADLAACDRPDIAEAARFSAEVALAYAQEALPLKQEKEQLRGISV